MKPLTIRHALQIILILGSVTSLQAQLISLKTIPVATGDQFLIFPSQNVGMGGVSVSLADTLLDPWIVPSRGSAITGMHLSSAPVYYRIANGDGDARSMPFSLQWSENKWFGGASLAIQALASDDNSTLFVPGGRTLSGNISENRYFAGFIGRRLPFLNRNIAVGAYWADLMALDGVDLLYSNSQKIEQEGDILDLRLSLSHERQDGVRKEILLLRNEIDMLHEVTYWDWGWERPGERVERNLDHTITLGLHSTYRAPLKEAGWHYGAVFTANRKSHPKIPNYEIMNIPRDPGNTTGFNIGGGISKSGEFTTFGIDFIYEPIWSNTWAEADTYIVNMQDQLIRPGDKTVENDFDFSNWIMRTGLRWENTDKAFQLGIQMRTIHYWLDQTDYITVTDRIQEEYWAEWTTSWGVVLKYPEFVIRYTGRTTMGTGRPGVETRWIWFGGFEDANTSGDFIIAPSDDLTLREARVMTHQLSISLPIGL